MCVIGVGRLEEALWLHGAVLARFVHDEDDEAHVGGRERRRCPVELQLECLHRRCVWPGMKSESSMGPRVMRAVPIASI